MIIDMDMTINSLADYENREALYLEIEKSLPKAVELEKAFSHLQEIRETLEDIPDPKDDDSDTSYFYEDEQENFTIDRPMDSLL